MIYSMKSKMFNMRDQGKTTQANNNGNSTDEKNTSNDSIRAADASRNDERDLKIGEEPDTKRLRSEKESAEQGKRQ